MDVHTRRLRYFVSVAEELHFGRAAKRHFVAQQAMSRQIRDLEAEIGTPLLERTTRRVSLTPAGEALLAASRKALAELDEGIDAARAAARSSVGELTVGFRFGAALELTTPILAAMARDHPGVSVQLRELDFRDPGRTYDHGRVDVAIVRSPTEHGDAELVPLVCEPRVAAVGQGHPLSRKRSVSVEDLVGVPIVVGDSSDETWLRYWTLEEERGEPPEVLIRANSQTEELELVASRPACSITVASAARYLAHPGVVYLPIEGVEPCTMALAFENRSSPVIRAFVDTAVAVCETETELRDYIENPFGARSQPNGSRKIRGHQFVSD